MKLFGFKVLGYAKALVIMVAILVVSLGLCGISSMIEAKRGWNADREQTATAVFRILDAVDIWSLVAIILSSVGIVLLLAGWAGVMVFRGMSGARSREKVKELFEMTDDTKGGRDR